jgi:hypothetical protein
VIVKHAGFFLSSQAIPPLAPGIDRSITVSANGRIVIVATPSLDVLQVFDQQDSYWVQRGKFIYGDQNTSFGKMIAISTLPGSIIGRRFGMVPILLAIGIHGNNRAGIRVVRWESNDSYWRPVGDVIEVCQLTFNDCDLRALDTWRDGNRLTLVAVRTDGVVLLYRTNLTETGTQPWELQYAAFGSFTGASLSGHTVVLALTRERFLEVYFPPDTKTDTTGNLTKVKHYSIDMKTEVFLIQTFLGYSVNASAVQKISAVKMGADGKSLLVHCEGKGGMDYIVRYIISLEVAPLANAFKNFSTSSLTEPDRQRGLQKVRFSADGSSMVVRVKTQSTNEQRLQAVVYNTTSQDFDTVGGDLRIDEKDFGLSHDAATVFQLTTEGPVAYALMSRCRDSEHYYHMSILLDESPSALSWSFETYKLLGSLSFRHRTVRECDRCYFDDDRFGRGIAAEDICVQQNFDSCLRVSFQSDIGMQTGSGMVLFRDGLEVTSCEGADAKRFVYLSNPDLEDTCRLEELRCSSGESHIIVQMDLDDLSSKDTSWTLKKSSGAILAEGGNFTNDEDRTTILTQACAPKNEVLRLSIRDGFPDSDFFGNMSDGDIYRIDGLCCDWGKGGYRVFIDGEEIHSLQGRRPFRQERLVFDRNGVIAQTVPVTIEMQTDAYPDEIIWWLETEDRSEIWWWRDYAKNFVLTPNAYVTETVYLMEGETYYLGMWDRFGDSFCCEFGNGYYNVYWGIEVDPEKLMLVGNASFDEENLQEQLLVISEDSILQATPTPQPQDNITLPILLQLMLTPHSIQTTLQITPSVLEDLFIISKSSIGMSS